MKNATFIALVLLFYNSCTSFKGYWEQPMPKKFVTPEFGLTINLTKDTVGQFKNNRPGQDPLVQKFRFSEISRNSQRHLVVNEASPLGKNDQIHLRKGDTIYLVKGQLLFFFKTGLVGTTQPLFFKKKVIRSDPSPHVVKTVKGKVYTHKSKKRILRLKFNDETLCVLENTFKCDAIDSNVRHIVIKCTYKREGDKIFLRNIDCPTDRECAYELTYPIADQASPNCGFLSQPVGQTRVMIGPTYATPFQKFATVPNIDMDTLVLSKKRVVLFKTDGLKSIGFIFR